MTKIGNNDPKITCESAYELGLEIDMGQNPRDKKDYLILDPSKHAKDPYVKLCINHLSFAIKSNPSRPPNRLWDKELLHRFKQRAEYRELPAKLAGPLSKQSVDGADIFISNDVAYANLAAWAFVVPENIDSAVDHEWGHKRDRLILLLIFPELKQLESMNNKDFATEIKKKYPEIWKGITKRLDTEEKKIFLELTKRVFGDFSSYSYNELSGIQRSFLELFRFGEEVYDADQEIWILSPDFVGLDEPAVRLDPKRRALIIAKVLETGLWDQLLTYQKISPQKAKELTQDIVDEIKLFRLVIRSASRCFPVLPHGREIPSLDIFNGPSSR